MVSAMALRSGIDQMFRRCFLDTLKRKVSVLACQSQLRGLRKSNPLVVHQMGKVGSSAVVRSLKLLRLSSPVLQVHTLSHASLSKAIDKNKEKAKRALPKHLIVSSMLRMELDRGAFPLRIITLTRDPVSRAISLFFEDMKERVPEAIMEGGGIDHKFIVAALDRMFSSGSYLVDPSRWFDKELLECFGVDVFSVPYDHAKGYVIQNRGEVKVLVMRMEDINRALPAALADFLDIDEKSVAVIRSNVGAEKWYAEELSRVKRELRLNPETAGEVLHTRYFNHFYEPDREALSRRWFR